MRLRVLLVTSDRDACGVREYGRMLMEAAPRDIEYREWPKPHFDDFQTGVAVGHDIVHLNHHAALHASWTEGIVREWPKAAGFPRLVVTQHDTFETFDLMRKRGLPDFRCADALVVHEPVEGLTGPNVHLIRQGVPPGPSGSPLRLGFGASPWVGTVGFPFPWKNYDLLCTLADEVGWGVFVIAPGATIAQCELWYRLNPRLEVVPRFLPRYEVVNYLARCDATAFLYSTGNSGTTAALRLGIAARRPVIAFHSRQTRDLGQDSRILWCADRESVVAALRVLATTPHLGQVMADAARSLAEQDSWRVAAAKYAEIYRQVVRGER